MFLSFFESFKYIGLFWPISLIRIFTGYVFLNAGIEKLQNHFLTEPVLQETLYKWMSQGIDAKWYQQILESAVLPHWQTFSYLVVFGELAVGLSFILGFLVRPAALVAIFMNLNFYLAAGYDSQMVNLILIAIHMMLFAVSAGRCIGFDYYFYKKVRGLWW